MHECEYVSGSSDNIVVVKTSLGDVLGRVVPAHLGDLSGVIVDEFLGIPFAVPPVGQLRYADPVALDRLPSGTLNPVPLDRLPSGTLTPHHRFISELCALVIHDYNRPN